MMNCPRCGSPHVQAVKFTWWGGLVGPKMMNLHKCLSCKLQYNAKTMQNAQQAILIYTLVGTAIGVIIMICGFVFHWYAPTTYR